MPAAYAMPNTIQPTILNRIRFHVAWATATTIFMSVGWTAMRAWDPHGPVSLLTNRHPSMMILEALALAAISAAVATILAGRAFPDMGVFAVGIGTSAVALRGDTATYLLLQRGASPTLCAMLLAECAFWFVVMMLAMLAAGIVVRWLEPTDPADPQAAPLLNTMSASSLPIVGRLFRKADPPDQSPLDVQHTLKHIAVAAIIALILIRILAAGATDRAIYHGQTCFAVAAAFYIAVKRAQTMFPLRSVFWSCCSVPLTCAAAMVIASVMSGSLDPQALAPVPPSTFLRILPIHYVGLGVASALFARWHAPSVDTKAA